LIDFEPAVGVPSFQGCLYRRAEVEVQTIFAFDQIVVAYHWETLPVLLPYTEVFDEESWWYCATVQHALCSVLFRNHTIMFNAVEAVNLQHRYHGEYKRSRAFNVPLTWIASAFTNFNSFAHLPFDDPTRQLDEGTPRRLHQRPNLSYLTMNPTIDWDHVRVASNALRYVLEYNHSHPYFAQRCLLQPFAVCPSSRSGEVVHGANSMDTVIPLVAEQQREL
jgi:hypothetical protein